MRSQTSRQWPTAAPGATSVRPYILAAILLPLVGAALLLYATPWGIGASPDSATFIGTARQLLSGQSLLTLPDTHQPPFYPLVLALFGVPGSDPLIGARWLHALLFAANIGLFGLLLNRIVNRMWLLAAGIILFALAAPIVTVHAFAWSEPLFILLGLSGFVFTASFLNTGSRRDFIMATLLTGLACVTRYAGIPLIAATALGLLLFADVSWPRRLASAAIFTFLSALPLFLWLARNLFVAGATTSRQFAFHPFVRTHVWQFFHTISSWLQIPETFPNILRLFIWGGLFVAAVAIFFWSQKRTNQNHEGITSFMPLIKLLVLFSVIYIAFLLFSISFFDANTPLDNRLLAPLFVAVLPIALFLFERVLDLSALRRWRQLLTAAPLLLLCTLTAFQGVTTLLDQRHNGLGYNSPAWHQSPLLAEIDNIPENTVIFSNAPEAIILLQNREAQALPRKNDAMTQTTNDSYQTELNSLVSQVENGTAVVAYFHALAHRPVTSEAELRAQFALDTVTQAADGVILGAGHKTEP